MPEDGEDGGAWHLVGEDGEDGGAWHLVGEDGGAVPAPGG